MFDKNEKTSLFINGSSLYFAARNLGFEVDYRMVLDFFRLKSRLMRAFYYIAIPETEDYSPLKPLTDWLAYNGYSLVTKTVREFTDQGGRKRLKGNMDVEIAVDLMEQPRHIDHAMIFSGDSDLRRVTEAVQRRGVRVTVISSLRSMRNGTTVPSLMPSEKPLSSRHHPGTKQPDGDHQVHDVVMPRRAW
ncbi:MAG: NYN domain-containing protein [Acetobacteraceae bacterium]